MKFRTPFIIALLLIGMVLGFGLEQVKVNINFILEYSARISGYENLSPENRLQKVNELAIKAPYDYYYNHGRILMLYELSISRLNQLKWVVTVLGTGFFFIINLSIVWLYTRSRLLVKWSGLAYVGLFLLSFVIFLVGKWTHTLDQAYGISRKIAGGLQSLVPLMIIVPGWWLWRQSQTTNK